MFKIFCAHCKSNWKINILSSWGGWFFYFIWMDMWRDSDSGGKLAAGVLAFLILVCVMPLFDLSLPRTLYICPYSFEDRKNYVRKAFLIRFIACVSLYFILAMISMGMQLIQNDISVYTWYSMLMQNILVAIFVWLNTIGHIVPSMGDDNAQDSYTRMSNIIGWHDTSYKMGYDIVVILAVLAIHEDKPALNAGCIIQWLLVVAGLLMIRGFYKKHYNLLVSLAADYETYEKYQKPIKK